MKQQKMIAKQIQKGVKFYYKEVYATAFKFADLRYIAILKTAK